MNYYKATIQYDGTGYAGFQWQNHAPTIQAEINGALEYLLSDKFSTKGASRTDSGVHAVKQVLKLTSLQIIEDHSFADKLNSYLPSQIRCLEFSPCPSDFNPATASNWKEYRYFFTNQKFLHTDQSRFITNISVSLDLDLMKRCLEELQGSHDFCNFYSTGSNVKSTVRTIQSIELTQINPHSLFKIDDMFKFPQEIERCYQIKMVGNGFLKQMVRHIMSAIWMVSSGALSFQEFHQLLKGPKQPKHRWKVARPNGLFLFDFY